MNTNHLIAYVYVSLVCFVCVFVVSLEWTDCIIWGCLAKYVRGWPLLRNSHEPRKGLRGEDLCWKTVLWSGRVDGPLWFVPASIVPHKKPVGNPNNNSYIYIHKVGTCGQEGVKSWHTAEMEKELSVSTIFACCVRLLMIACMRAAWYWWRCPAIRITSKHTSHTQIIRRLPAGGTAAQPARRKNCG